MKIFVIWRHHERIFLFYIKWSILHYNIFTKILPSRAQLQHQLAMELRSLKAMLPEVAVLLLVEQEQQAQLKPLERLSFLPVLTVQVQEQQQLPPRILAVLNGNILIELGDLFPPLVSTVLYVRVRTMLANGRPGAWSTPNVKWITTRDCLEISYLGLESLCRS